MRAFSLIESIISLGIFLIVLSLILSSVMTFSQVSSRYKQIFSFHSLTESIPRILDDLTLISQVEGDYIQLKRNATQWYVEWALDEDAALFYRHDYSFQETNASNHIRHSCRIDDRKDLDISTRFVISCTFKSYYHDSLVSEKSLQFSFWQ